MEARATPYSLMWGNSVVVNVVSGGAATTGITPAQLTRVDFDRPESWSFFFSAEIISAAGNGGAPIAPGQLFVDYEVMFGVGRSVADIKRFQRFGWTWLAGGIPAGLVPGGRKFSSSVQTPVIDETAVTPEVEHVEWITAQNIQTTAQVQLNTPVAGDNVQVQVYAGWSPRTHINAGWFGRKF